MFSVFRSQLSLGFESLLHGLIVNKLIHHQQIYYSSMESRKLSTRWGIRLTGKLWIIIQQLWIHRNNVLYNTPSIDILSGKENLSTTISSEYALGFKYPPNVYASYFLIPLHLLLIKPVMFQKSSSL